MASSGRGGLGIFEMPNPFDSTFATFYPPYVAAPLQMEGVPLEGWVPPELPTLKPLLSSWERDLYHYRQAQIYVEAHQESQAREQAMLRTMAQENAKAIAEAKAKQESEYAAASIKANKQAEAERLIAFKEAVEVAIKREKGKEPVDVTLLKSVLRSYIIKDPEDKLIWERGRVVMSRVASSLGASKIYKTVCDYYSDLEKSCLPPTFVTAEEKRDLLLKGVETLELKHLGNPTYRSLLDDDEDKLIFAAVDVYSSSGWAFDEDSLRQLCIRIVTVKLDRLVEDGEIALYSECNIPKFDRAFMQRYIVICNYA